MQIDRSLTEFILVHYALRTSTMYSMARIALLSPSHFIFFYFVIFFTFSFLFSCVFCFGLWEYFLVPSPISIECSAHCLLWFLYACHLNQLGNRNNNLKRSPLFGEFHDQVPIRIKKIYTKKEP